MPPTCQTLSTLWRAEHLTTRYRTALAAAMIIAS
jgi:hypothetical protein